MREILFRGKCKDDGPWVEGGVLQIPGYTAICAYDDYHGWHDFVEVIPDTVGQYTGLTDNNGKMIFEGDIVKCIHCWEPKWEDCIFPEFADEAEMIGKFLGQKIKYAYGKHTGLNDLGTAFYYYRNYIVEYNKKTGGWRLRNGNVIHPIESGTLYNRKAEIIGNIHDNPELLEGGE